MRAARVVLLSLLLAGTAGAVEPSPDEGRALFIGTRPFQAAGPPCGACHATGGGSLAFAASLGPDLSTSPATEDADALIGLLESNPFPTMAPIYEARALTPAERADVAAYLVQAARQGPPAAAWQFEACGALVALVLFAALALASRRRKPHSRARLIARVYPSHDGGAR